MVRHLALLAFAAATPLAAASLPRSFTITSFDRIRVEGPYAVAVATGRAPFARAEGTADALDAIDLRVEGRTLIVRQRSGSASRGGGAPVRITVGTPDLRSASLIGSGSLQIDRLRGLAVELGLFGPGSLGVAELAADRVSASVQGSGSLTLSGKAKSATLIARGTPALRASGFEADEVTIAAEGAGELIVAVKSRATVTAAGTAQVRLQGRPACLLKVSGSALVEGCATAR